MSIFGASPTFAAGQVFSAAIHGNGVDRLAQVLRDAFQGPQLPFVGIRAQWGGSWAWTYTQEWALRHKYDRLDYSFTTDAPCTATLSINGVNVPGATLTTSYGSATLANSNVDLSSLGLTVDQFYIVKLTATGPTTVTLLREARAVSLPTLAAFADGDTPTAAQWQALSDYADELGALQEHPQALGMAVRQALSEGYGGTLLHGTLNHRCRYLAYSFKVTAPYNTQDDGRWTEARIAINGTVCARFRVGKQDSIGSATCYYEKAGGTGQGATADFVGVLDLNTYPGGLTLGTDYTIDVLGVDTTYWDTVAHVELVYLYEAPDAAGLLSWSNPTAWAHGLFVRGSTGAPKMQTTTGNLATLGSVVTYHNYPTLQITAGSQRQQYGVRRWRYLHYRTVADANPQLTYTFRGKPKVVALADASAQWLRCDMQAQEGLYPGTVYTLANVQYALEDAVV